MTDPSTNTLEDKVLAHVRDWLARNAPIVRDRGEIAQLKLELLNPGGDDDGTLVLEWRYRETVHGPRYDEECEGRVPGVEFK